MNIRCNFFHWHPSSYRFSPTTASSQSSQFQPSVNLFSQPLGSFQPLTLPPAPSQATLVTVKCLSTGCNSASIWKGCTHRRCKHHCKERGGCLSHGNTQELVVPQSLPASLTPPPTSEGTAWIPPLSSIADLTPWSPVLLAETQPPTTPTAPQTHTIPPHHHRLHHHRPLPATNEPYSLLMGSPFVATHDAGPSNHQRVL